VHSEELSAISWELVNTFDYTRNCQYSVPCTFKLDETILT